MRNCCASTSGSPANNGDASEHTNSTTTTLRIMLLSRPGLSRNCGERPHTRSAGSCSSFIVHVVPLRGVADANRSPLHDFPERAGAPRRAQRIAQTLARVIHLMAGPRLAEDANLTVADPKRFPARILEIDAAQQDVGATSRRIHIHAELELRLRPRSFVDQRDLPPPALIGISAQTVSGNHFRFTDAIHRTAVRAL